MLTEERKGQIAIKVLKFKMFKDGIRLSKDTPREFSNAAKELGVPVEEFKEFAKEITQECLDKVFK